jgi:hypothetical protein
MLTQVREPGPELKQADENNLAIPISKFVPEAGPAGQAADFAERLLSSGRNPVAPFFPSCPNKYVR